MLSERSNVMPTSNVARRNGAVDSERAERRAMARSSDPDFAPQVRGGPAIRALIVEILGRSTPPPTAAEEQRILSHIRPEQYQQRLETLRCRRCDRINYGPTQSAEGGLRWRFLLGSECRCGAGI